MLRVEIGLNHAKGRPEFSLYGLKALLDTGSSGLFVNLDPDVIMASFGGHRCGETRAVTTNGIAVQDVYVLKHFQIDKLEFFDIPVVVPKKADEMIPAFLVGLDVFGPASIVTIDNRSNELVADVQELYALTQRRWMLFGDGKWHIAGFKDGQWVALYNDYDHFSLDEIK